MKDLFIYFWRYILLLLIFALVFSGFDFEISRHPKFVINNPLMFAGILLVFIGILFICADVYNYRK